MEKSDRGSLLLSVPSKHVRARIAGLAIIAVCLIAFAAAWMWGEDFGGKPQGFLFLFELSAFAFALGFVRPWSFHLFGQGVQIPRNMNFLRTRGRFIPWSEFERYYWVSDVLYLSTSKSVYTWTVAPANRAAMEAILSQHIAQPAVS